MNTLHLSIISFSSIFALTLTVKWLLKKYPRLICKVTGKHKTGSTFVFMNAIGEHDWFTKCDRCNHVTGPFKNESNLQAHKSQGYGGVRVTFYFNSNDVEPFPCIGQVPEEKPKTKFEKLQSIIDRTPDKWLQYQLENAIIEEDYELASYIKDVARQRGVKLEIKS